MLSINGWKVSIRNSYRSFDKEIFIFKECDDKTLILQPDLKSTIKIANSTFYDTPTIRLNYTIIEAIFNSLWDEGQRPKDRRYENEMDLIKNHLEDMRKLVFKTK